jgi:hypothetical protein
MLYEKNIMNSHILYAWLLTPCLLMAGCATPHKPESTIDACKLTKPPKEAVIDDIPHMGEMYKYPGALPDNYSGCKKIWINHYLAFSIIVNNGSVSRMEFIDPDGEGETEVCNYDKNKKLMKGSSSKCTAYSELLDDLWKK